MDVTGVSTTYEQPVKMPATVPVQNGQSSPSQANGESVEKAGNANAMGNKPTIVSPAEREREKFMQSQIKTTPDVIEKTIQEINKSLTTFNREMHVSVHEKTRQIMVKVMDTEENKVIRELPPEKVLDAFAKTLELAGILVDRKS